MASPSPSSLLLHSISSTLLLTLLLPLLFRSPHLYRASRQRVFLVVSSSTCVALSGLTGLVGVGRGSRGAAVVGGVCGALAVALVDVHILLVLWQSQKGEEGGGGGRKPAKVAVAGVLSVFLFAATVLHVALLCLDSPAHSLLLAIAVSRTVVHIVFALLGIAAFGVLLLHSLDGEKSKFRNPEDTLKARKLGESYDVWRTTTYDEAPPAFEAGKTRFPSVVASSEARLIALQALAVLLDVFSVVFPLKQNYPPFSFSSNGRAAPTLYGTTLSPAGHLVVALFVVVRWTCLISEVAGSAPSSLSAPSRSSLAAQYHRTPTPSPSTVPLAPNSGETPLSSPTSTRRPSTSMSRILTDALQSPLASRSASPWSTRGMEQGEITGNGVRRMRSLSSSPTRPTLSLGSKGGGGERQTALVSFLSLGQSQSSSINEATEQGVRVQTVELQHPYYHTETLPSSYGDGETEEGGGTTEDLVVVSTPLPSPRRPRRSPSSRRKSPPPITPLPSTARVSSSAESSPVMTMSGTKRSSSSLSGLTPLLKRRELDSAQGTVSTFSFGANSPPSSPEQARDQTSPTKKRTSAVSLSEPSTPTGAVQRPYPHASSSSGATAYYSLPRSPPPLVLPLASPILPLPQQGSLKKGRRPSLGRLPSFGGGSSSGAVTPINGPGGGDSPTRTRSGSVGSLLRTLRRESTTPSLAAASTSATTTTWEIEPNEEEDDPFAPAPVSGEGKRQEERVKGWERDRETRRSIEALVLAADLSGVETVLERSDENEEAVDLNEEEEETGSVVDHGAEDVERVSTPVALAIQDDFLISQPSPALAAVTTRSRAGSEASSVFIEHLDVDLSSPPRLTHSVSASVLEGADAASRINSEKEKVPPLASPTEAPSLTVMTAITSSPSPSSPFDALKRVASRRPSLAALSPPSAPPTRKGSFTRRVSSSTAAAGTGTSAPSLFSSASFTLRKFRLRSSSVADAAPFRTSTGSDLSFACRGSTGSSGQSDFAVETREALPAAVAGKQAVENEKDGIEKVESISTAVEQPRPLLVEQQAEGAQGRSTWWKKLPGSRPSTHYRRASTPLPRSGSSAGGTSSFPSFLQLSTPSSSKSSHEPYLYRSQSLRLTPLTAFQLDQHISVSSFGSFLAPSSTRSSSDHPPQSTTPPYTPRQSLEAAFASAFWSSQPALHPLSREQLGQTESDATSRLSFTTARSTGEGGTIEEEHLSELDDLVRTFSPGSLPHDPEWPSYPSSAPRAGGELFPYEVTGSSFEFSEGGFDPLRYSEEETDDSGTGNSTFHPGVLSSSSFSRRPRRHSAPLPLTSSPTTPTAGQVNFSSASFSESEFSPTSPAFSFGSMALYEDRGDEQDFLVSPVTPASFSFAKWAEGVEAERERGEETTVQPRRE